MSSFLRQPAKLIPEHCWKFFDFSPSKDSSMCKWPNRWSAFFLLLWPWARSPPTMNSSERGPGRTESARYQSAPSLGFGSIPLWRTGKEGKGVGTFLRGHYTMQQQSWWGHPLFCRFSAVNIFSCTRIHAKTLHYFPPEPSKWGRFWRCHRILWTESYTRSGWNRNHFQYIAK